MTRSNWITVAILALLVALKTEANSGYIDWWYDGGYYADIADHIARGNGFVTDISIYHQGLPSFPHPTPVYPLWPLTLGLVASVIGMKNAAVGLPTVFYFGAVFLAGRIAKSIDDQPFISWFPDLRPSHVAIVALGLDDRFFEYTSRPYTEGMAFFALLLGYFPIRRLLSQPSVALGGCVGIYLGLLCLIRGPFIVVALAVFSAIALRFVLAGPRLLGLASLGAVGAGVGAVIAGLSFWYAQIPGAELGHLIRFDEWVVSPGLSTQALLESDGPVATAIASFFPAFSIRSEFAYYRNFGYLPYAALVALPWFILGVWRKGVRGGVRALLNHPGLALVCWLGFAQGAALHVIHKAAFTEWNFAMRHAVGVAMIFVPAAIYACRLPGLSGAFSALLVSASMVRAVDQGFQSKEVVQLSSNERERRMDIGKWLVGLKEADPDLRVGHPGPQLIDRYAPGVHWIVLHNWTTADDLELMRTRDGLDLIVVPRDFELEKYDFWEDPAFRQRWTEVPDVPGKSKAFQYEEAP